MKLQLLIALASLLVCPLRAADQRPNIIFILADDLGWGDLACYGHPYAKTPNLDRLAAEGTRFTRFHATGVTCCPARTGLMTGKLPATFQKYPASFGFGDRATVTELLKKSGYKTGHFGKWHIGPVTEAGTYGIDVISNGEINKRRQAEDTRGRDAPIFDAAIRFIEEHKAGPFYVNVWTHISHHPVNPSVAVRNAFGPLVLDAARFSPAMREKFELCEKLGGDTAAHLQAFLADVKSMDDDIGRLLVRVDELGLRENTLVVFSSDQGAAPLRDPGELAGKKNKGVQGSDMDAIRLNAMGYAGPFFRGGKHTQLQGGVCVPFIARWPLVVPAGRVDETSVISGADWLPTVCSMARIPFDADDYDGEDASSALRGESFMREKALFWKTSTEKSDPAILMENWKLHGSLRRKGEVTLHDLRSDPSENVNVADSHADVLERLNAKLAAWLATLPTTYEKGDDKED